MNSETRTTDKIISVVNAQRRLLNVVLFFGVLATLPLLLPLVSRFYLNDGNGLGPSLMVAEQIANYLVPLWGLIFLFSVGKLAYVMDGVGSAIAHCLLLLVPPIGLCLAIYLNTRASYYVLPLREYR